MFWFVQMVSLMISRNKKKKIIVVESPVLLCHQRLLTNVRFLFMINCIVPGLMYTYFGSLDVPAMIMGCVQILGALLTILLYIYVKCKENNSDVDLVTVL